MTLKINHGAFVFSCCNLRIQTGRGIELSLTWAGRFQREAGPQKSSVSGTLLFSWVGRERRRKAELATGVRESTRTQTWNGRLWVCLGPGRHKKGQKTFSGTVLLWGCLFSNCEATSVITVFNTLLLLSQSLIWGAKQNTSFLQYLLLEASWWNAQIPLGMISHSLQNGNSFLFPHEGLNCFQCTRRFPKIKRASFLHWLLRSVSAFLCFIEGRVFMLPNSVKVSNKIRCNLPTALPPIERKHSKHSPQDYVNIWYVDSTVLWILSWEIICVMSVYWRNLTIPRSQLVITRKKRKILPSSSFSSSCNLIFSKISYHSLIQKSLSLSSL